MPARVADASVLAAILFGEPQANEALSLLGGVDLYEPTLLAYELASIARKKVTLYPNHRDAIFEALLLGLALDIEWISVSHIDALRLALSLGLTTYDASYAQVASSLRVPLVTFDRRLSAAARDLHVDFGSA